MYNPFEEAGRLQKIGLMKQTLMAKRINIFVELNEENYINLDSIHLSLLEKLKTLDDQIKKLESDEKYIKGVESSDVVQKYFNEIDDMFGFEDDPIITSEEWEEMRKLGK